MQEMGQNGSKTLEQVFFGQYRMLERLLTTRTRFQTFLFLFSPQDQPGCTKSSTDEEALIQVISQKSSST